MSWDKQKNAMWGGALLIVGVLTFCLGAAVGVSQTLKDFQETFIPLMSMIGTWVAGIATAGAVWVALWLAESEKRADVENIRGRMDRVNIDWQTTDVLGVQATSNGKRSTILTSIAFKSPKAENYLHATFFHHSSAKLPVTLSYGQTALFVLDDAGKSCLLEYILSNCQGSARGLKVVVTSTIREYEIELAPELETHLEGQARLHTPRWQ